MPIRLLDPDVSSIIAAGEVIDRPASVVKELIENALDAGSTEISVEVQGDGTQSIRVVDNGHGIGSNEVALAFERYATSKLSVARDLDSIRTLGFRGEALPSIAAVSRLSMVTKAGDAPMGVRIELLDGKVTSVNPAGAKTGTVVLVRQLFRNFPARRRFMRTRATEISRIHTIVSRYALAYSTTRFRLVVDEKEALASTGSGNLREAASNVYGRKTSSQMLDLIADDSPTNESVTVDGLIGLPQISKSNRSNISFFTNGRWIQSRMLSYALEQAYQGFMKERRYPTAVINITVPSEEVDVNIHPTKAEVKFRHESSIFSAVQRVVRYTLTSHLPVPEASVPNETQNRNTAFPTSRPFWPVNFKGDELTTLGVGNTVTSHDSNTDLHTPNPNAAIESIPSTPANVLNNLRVLGQIHTTYIVAEGPTGMYLVDQHAAHERVLFEMVCAHAETHSGIVQSLLEPVMVELDSYQHELMSAQSGLIEHIGFRVEPFGDKSYLVRGVPQSLSESDPTLSLTEVLDRMAEGGGFETWQMRAAYSIACHGAIRAGKKLTHQEMSELVNLLEECQQPHTCPHGRPTMIFMGLGHLEREFGRR
ncbi:MAG: DNA mismatch repair endonuclease MutL [SAR202 cluster bacterium]|nr:DNA mismatch repair endonuclease MutL [SAR202 cluster bacterium]